MYGHKLIACAILGYMLKRHFLVIFLLCIAIPAQGFASMQVLAHSCPMHNAVSSEVAEPCPMQHCCNDADTFNKTGNTCKTGQECQAGYLFPFSPCVVQTPLSTQSMRITHPPLFISSFEASGIWRPPALI